MRCRQKTGLSSELRPRNSEMIHKPHLISWGIFFLSIWIKKKKKVLAGEREEKDNLKNTL